MQPIYRIVICFLCAGILLPVAQGSDHRMDRYNVVWNAPSKDASGQMPLGNGDIAAGVYAIENGDLYLLLAKNDAYNYNGDIFKTGRVRISLTPNPFAGGKAWVFGNRLDGDSAYNSVLCGRSAHSVDG